MNSATVNGGLQFAPGQFGQAFNFTATGHEVLVPASPSLNVGAGEGFTIEGWIQPAQVSTQMPILEFNDGSGLGLHLWTSVGFSGFGGPGAVYAAMRNGPLEGIVATRAGVLSPNVWQHVALTFDASSRLARIFLNGVEMTNRVIAPSVGQPLTTQALHLGFRSGISFQGKLDEMALYNRALSPVEILAVAGTGKCIPQTPLPNGPGSALSLDGIDDHVSVPAGVWFSGDFTVESWVFPRSHNNYARLLDFGVDQFNNNVVIALSSGTTGRPLFQVFSGTVAGPVLIAPSPLPTNQWSHVACVLSNNTGTIYVNGVAVVSGPLSRPINITRGRCYFGRSNWASDAYANAVLDEVRIWGVARTSAQLQQTMRQQLFGNESGLVACYRFDEGTGLASSDATGNPTTIATLVNGPTWQSSSVSPFSPTVTTLPFVNYTPATATLRGSSVPNGANSTGWFQWGPASGFSNVTLGQALGNSDGVTNWSRALTGLAPGQLGLARAVATNIYGTSYGGTMRAVQNTNDSGLGSLRQAVQSAGAGDRILFAPGLTGTIGLTTGEILIAKNLTLVGPGSRNLTISGNQLSRVLHFVGCNVTLSGCTIAEGSSADGGGLLIEGGDVWIDQCVFASNRSDYGGGLNARGNCRLDRCTFVGNTASGGLGGGIRNGGTMTLVNCTIAGNAALSLAGGGIGNVAALTLIHCTISGNSGISGGGLLNQGTAQIRNSIIAGNSERFAGNGWTADVLADGIVGTLVSSGGFNLIGIVDGSSGWLASDRLGSSGQPLNAFLGPVADNGGSTPTMALLAGSPAIDHGDNSVLGPPLNIQTDQRGLPRRSGGNVDIGAYEWEGYILGRIIPRPPGVGPTNLIVTVDPPAAAFWHPPTTNLYATAAGFPYTITWRYSIDTNNFTNVVTARNSWPSNDTYYQIHVADSPAVDLATAGPQPTFQLRDQDENVGASLDAFGRKFSASSPGRSLIMVSPGSPLLTNIYFQFIRTVNWDDPAYLVDREPAVIGQAIQPQLGWHDTNFGGAFVFFPNSRYCAQPNYYDRTNRTGPIIPVNRDRSNTTADDMVLVYYERGQKLFNPLNLSLTNIDTGWPYKPVRYDCQWPVSADRIVIASQLGGRLDGLSNPAIYAQNDPSRAGYNPNEEHAFFFNQIGRDARLQIDRTEIAVAEGGSTTVNVSIVLPQGVELETNVVVSVAGLREGDTGLIASFSPTALMTEATFSLQDLSSSKVLYVTALTNADPTEALNGTNLITLRAYGGLVDQKQILVREVDTNRLALVVDAAALSIAEPGNSSIGVHLSQPPTSPVTVTLTAVPGADSDVSLDTTSLTFTALDWNVPQFVTVSADEDSDSGNDTATFEIRASGGLTQTNRLVVTVQDDDPPPLAVYALRDDLGDRPGASPPFYSEPYVLVTYQNGQSPPAIRVYRVVAEESPYFFTYLNNFAGRQVQPPYPISQLQGWEAQSYAVSGPWWQDRKRSFWARAAGDNGGTNHIQMKFFYPRRSEFDFAPGTDPGGTYIPWLDRRPGGTVGVPTTVTYEIKWPDDVPELRIGESLVKAKFGLPNIKGQTSVDIIYEQSAAQGFGPQSSIKLIDAEFTHSAPLTALPADTDGRTVTNQLGGGIVAPGSVFFTVLPPHLRSRLWWEPPPNSRLRFTGRFVEEFGTEEPVGYLNLNVLTARDLASLDAISSDSAFRNVLRNDLAGPGKAGSVKLVPTNTVQRASASTSDTFALTAGLASRAGYVTVAFNNVVNSGPVSLQLIKVTCPLYRGETKAIYPDDPFSETTAVRHSGDFAGQADGYIFEWQYHQGPGKPSPSAPTWIPWTNGFGAVDMVAGGSGSRVLNDWWYRCRWRTTNVLNPCGTNFTAWTDPVLVEGWIKRVLANINFFNQRYTNLVNSGVDTLVNVIGQAGTRWLGQVPLNAEVLQNSAEFGLIAIYETILKRGIELTIEGTPPQGSANQPLLQVASQLANIYMLLGNEAYADAADPTIGFVTTGGQYGVEATSVHCFMDQTGSLLEEELALLRGLDSSEGRDIRRHPIYNRLPPNMGSGLQGEPAYALNYPIKDVALPIGTIDALDAQRTYPQGHGDAWGHYLTAINNYYRLLANPVFSWANEIEFVKLTGGLGDIPVNYQHERRFAQVAAAKARTGAEIVNLTYRNRYVENPDGQWQGYLDTDAQRAWGLSEWASRAGQGAFLDWVTANALLPSTSPGVGLAKVDRTTVAELREIGAAFVSIQGELDKADAGVNPLGLSKNVIPFDIDPARTDAGATHFEQIQERAIKAVNNAIGVFNHANASTQKLREQADEVSKFTLNVEDREHDYTNRLIEVFGYPYPDDPTFAGNANVPDLVHYMYADFTQITGELPSESVTIPVSVTSIEVNPDGTLKPGTNRVGFNLAVNGVGLTKPLTWTRPRRAPGEIQMAHSELLQSTARFKRALNEFENLINQIEDQAGLLRAQFNLNASEIKLLKDEAARQESLDKDISAARQRQLNFQKQARVAVLSGNALAEALPKTAGFSIDATSFGRSALMILGNLQSEGYTSDANAQAMLELDHQQAKQAAQNLQNIRLTTLRNDPGIRTQLAQIEQLVRQQALLSLELFTQQEVVRQVAGRFASTLAKGQRLLEERLRFRQQTAAQVQGYRYKDMAFRIFRNEALQQYRAQFDSAAMYVYLAAAAYDYETNLRDTETRWRPGSSLLTDIVRARSIGVIDGAGNPQPGPGAGRRGDGGLAAALYSMNFNWSDSQRPLRSQLGFNNPARENLTFSLRSALFRCLTNQVGDGSWRAWLTAAVVPDVGSIPEFIRYCKPPNQFGSGGRPEPGIVIPFSSAILYGHNFFGWPESGGGGNFSASYFTTKIKSTSVRFLGYDASHLTTTPHVYLVPVGNDVMLSPITQGFEIAPTREWKILDQFLPTPPTYGNISITLTNNPGWIPIAQLGTADEPFLAIRRYAQMRAYHDGGINGTPTNPELEAYKRLIGRSAWNTKWLLIILGGDLLGANPDRGVQTFINGYLGDGEGVSDIEVQYSTYSYPGN